MNFYLSISSEAFMQAFINGLALAWIYILMALGLVLILGIMDIMQFAHGEVYMLGAYVIYYFSVIHGVNFYLAMLLSVILIASLGVFLERFFLRPVRGKILSAITVCIALTLILQNSATIGFGLREKHIIRLAEGSFDILGSAIAKDRVIAMAFALFLTFLLYVFLKRSKYGQAISATAQNWEGAVLQGISPNQMSAIVMVIGSALAGVAGGLGGSIFELSPSMGTEPLLKGLMIIVIGGMGSLLGAVVAGLILGLTDSIVTVVFGPVAATLLPLFTVIFILIMRPHGLFGHE